VIPPQTTQSVNKETGMSEDEKQNDAADIEAAEQEKAAAKAAEESQVDGPAADAGDEEAVIAEAVTEEISEGSPVAGDAKKTAAEDELVEEADAAADYLEELLDIADMDGDIDSYSEGDRAHVSVVTDSEVLVGKDGEVLEALQELSRLAVLTTTGHRSRLMLDVAGHREKRRKELQLFAQDAINDVNESGEAVRLAPMNPFERKIVHDAVKAAGLFSESEGEEPRRRVVVQPAK
jgi:spoIIIJ-associated protein